MPERFEFPEGATPIGDCSGLIPVWVHHLHDLNRVEAENIMNSQRKYLQGRIGDPPTWFQLKELKAIHQAMFGDVWEWTQSAFTSYPGFSPARQAPPLRPGSRLRRTVRASGSSVRQRDAEARSSRRG